MFVGTNWWEKQTFKLHMILFFRVKCFWYNAALWCVFKSVFVHSFTMEAWNIVLWFHNFRWLFSILRYNYTMSLFNHWIIELNFSFVDKFFPKLSSFLRFFLGRIKIISTCGSLKSLEWSALPCSPRLSHKSINHFCIVLYIPTGCLNCFTLFGASLSGISQ